METIVALAGRRVDSDDAEIERFPVRNIRRVQTAIATELEKHRAKAVVSSAAAGVDLLGIAAAIKLRIDIHVILSPNIEEFARTSVEDRGPDWVKHFTSAIAAIPPNHIVRLPAQASIADTFRSINERILNEAIALSEPSRSRKPICFAAWDGQSRGEEDFSAHFLARAEALGLPIVTINTL
jgi:hypothetical protein